MPKIKNWGNGNWKRNWKNRKIGKVINKLLTGWLRVCVCARMRALSCEGECAPASVCARVCMREEL